MKKTLVYVLLLLTVIFWGTSFAVVKLCIGNLPPVQFLYLRALFASIVFCMLLPLFPKSKRKIESIDIKHLCFLSFMGIGGYFVIQYTALRYTSTVNASILVGLAPIFIALYSSLFLREKLDLIRCVGISLSFIGILLLISKGDLSHIGRGNTLLGDILMIINAIMLAIFSLGAERLLNKYEPFIVVAYLNIISLIMLTPLVFTSNFLSPLPIYKSIGLINTSTLLGALYLAITCTVFAYYSWYCGIKEIGPSKTSVFNYINPLVATILSCVMFNEGINAFSLIGGFMVIGGVVLNNYSSGKS